MIDNHRRRPSLSRIKDGIKEVPWYSWIVFFMLMAMMFVNVWAMEQANRPDIDVVIEGSRDSTVLLKVYAVYDDDKKVIIETRQVMLDVDGRGSTHIFIPNRYKGADSFELMAKWRGLHDSEIVYELPSEVKMHLREYIGE